MQSLREIRSVHSNLLVIDSASTSVQVGLLLSGREERWQTDEQESGVAIFKLVELLLKQATFPLVRIDAFIFCEGPGSVLGIRTAAMAIRTWQVLRTRPCFSYRSLELVVASQLRTGRAVPFSAIADARRELWHCVDADSAGAIGSVQRRAASEITHPSITPDVFRRWSALPSEVELVPYTISKIFQEVSAVPLFRPCTDPDAFLHEEPAYRTWTPQIHRAPC